LDQQLLLSFQLGLGVSFSGHFCLGFLLPSIFCSLCSQLLRGLSFVLSLSGSLLLSLFILISLGGSSSLLFLFFDLNLLEVISSFSLSGSLVGLLGSQVLEDFLCSILRFIILFGYCLRVLPPIA